MLSFALGPFAWSSNRRCDSKQVGKVRACLPRRQLAIQRDALATLCRNSFARYHLLSSDEKQKPLAVVNTGAVTAACSHTTFPYNYKQPRAVATTTVRGQSRLAVATACRLAYFISSNR